MIFNNTKNLKLTKSDVASIVSNNRISIAKLGRRMLVAKQDLRCLLKLSPGLEELLHEHLAQYDVVFALERGAENHRHSIV